MDGSEGVVVVVFQVNILIQLLSLHMLLTHSSNSPNIIVPRPKCWGWCRSAISMWRHIAIGISNRYFNKVFGDGMGDGFDEGEDEGIRSLIDSIYDLQAGYGLYVRGLIYARMFGQGDLGMMRSREQFCKVSMQWHQFFGLGAEDRTEWIIGAKRGRSMYDADREDVRRKRFGRLYCMDMQG